MGNNSQRSVVPQTEERNGIKSWMERDWRFPVAAAAVIVGGLSLTVSLVHLTPGLANRTGDPIWLALILAVVIDASILVTEAALVVASTQHLQGVKPWAYAWLFIALGTSWWLNAVHLTQGKEFGTWSWGGNVFLGALIPTAVLVLSKIGSALVVGSRNTVVVLPSNGEQASLEEVRVAGKVARAAYRRREKAARS